MQSKTSRRAVIKAALIAGVCVPTVYQLAHAAAGEVPPLDPDDPAAVALGFVTDTTKVDASVNPAHQPMQKCGTCSQFQGKPGDARGGCNIFAGHSVPQGGWCKVWAQKPGV
jgi:High potential iron-sulfur protein